MNDCVFCKIVKGEIPSVKIWEDKKYLAFLDVNPVSPGHTLLMPKKHSDYLFDLKDKEYLELMLNAKKIAEKLKARLNSKRIGMIVEGFAIPHVHVHLIPISNINELNPRNAKPVSMDELKKIADKISK